MHVISRKRLREFWAKHREAESPLRAWYKLATVAQWKNFSDIRADCPRADRVGRCIVFDIGGNKFRLVVTARLDFGRLYVRHVLTHAEYDRGKWKEDC